MEKIQSHIEELGIIRKIIQVSVVGSHILALCDDGTLWETRHAGNDRVWVKVPIWEITKGTSGHEGRI